MAAFLLGFSYIVKHENPFQHSALNVNNPPNHQGTMPLSIPEGVEKVIGVLTS